MMISFSCPGCAHPFRVEQDKAGKKTKCPACKTNLVVPTKSPTPEPASISQVNTAKVVSSGPLSEDEIFRMLEGMKTDDEPVVHKPSSDETVIENAIRSPLTPTPGTPMAPVSPQTKSAPSVAAANSSATAPAAKSAAEAAEEALRRARERRRAS